MSYVSQQLTHLWLFLGNNGTETLGSSPNITIHSLLSEYSTSIDWTPCHVSNTCLTSSIPDRIQKACASFFRWSRSIAVLVNRTSAMMEICYSYAVQGGCMSHSGWLALGIWLLWLRNRIFHFIPNTFNLNSHMWLLATVLDSTTVKIAELAFTCKAKLRLL